MTTFVPSQDQASRGPVPVELDAVALGVVEVEGLADQVVGAAGEGARLELGRGGDGGGQGRLVLEEQRGVEEAGLAPAGKVQARAPGPGGPAASASRPR